jgi:AraC-like DNA-binding protein
MASHRDRENSTSGNVPDRMVAGTSYEMKLELSSGETDTVLVDEKRNLTDRVIERHHQRVLLSNGGSVDYQRLPVDQDMVIKAATLSGRRLIVAMIALEGEYSMVLPEDGAEVTYSAFQGHLFVHNGLSTTFKLSGGQNVQSLGLSLTPEVFKRYFDNKVPGALRPLLEPDANDIQPVRFSVTSAMRDTLLHALNIDAVESLQQIKMEGIGLLYLALIEQSLRDGLHNQPAMLKRTDVGNAQRAYQMLQGSLRKPPCLADLAEELSTTEKRLNQTFRELYSDTVFEVLRGLRLEKAKKLLESTDMAIKEVAWEVGYNHSTNFSTAFNQKFGVPPAEYAKSVRSAVLPQVKNV